MLKIRYCEVCGVSSNEKTVVKNKKFGKCLCKKHLHQFEKFGKALDSNSRGVFDPNEIRILEDCCEIDTYDQYGNVLFTYKFDKEDLEKAKQFKWRTVLKNNGKKPYLVTGNQESQKEYFHRYIVNNPKDKEIDHIDGNTLNNCKSNLRILNKFENQLNMKEQINSISKIRGISKNKKGFYQTDFSYKTKRYYFKPMSNIEEAVYLRYLCEITFQKDFRYKENDTLILEYISKLSNERKESLYNYFKERINTSKDGV